MSKRKKESDTNTSGSAAAGALLGKKKKIYVHGSHQKATQKRDESGSKVEVKEEKSEITSEAQQEQTLEERRLARQDRLVIDGAFRAELEAALPRESFENFVEVFEKGQHKIGPDGGGVSSESMARAMAEDKALESMNFTESLEYKRLNDKFEGSKNKDKGNSR